MNNETESINEAAPLYTQPGGKQGSGTVEHDHVYEDYKAGQAIEGLPPSVIADKLKFLEKEWNDWTVGESIDIPRAGWFAFPSSLSRMDLVTMAADAFRVIRLQVRELALAYSEELIAKRAAGIQADMGGQLIAIQKRDALFLAFLKEHFENDLDRGRAEGKNLLEIAQGVMIRAKA